MKDTLNYHFILYSVHTRSHSITAIGILVAIDLNNRKSHCAEKEPSKASSPSLEAFAPSRWFSPNTHKGPPCSLYPDTVSITTEQVGPVTRTAPSKARTGEASKHVRVRAAPSVKLPFPIALFDQKLSVRVGLGVRAYSNKQGVPLPCRPASSHNT